MKRLKLKIMDRYKNKKVNHLEQQQEEKLEEKINKVKLHQKVTWEV
jgi:hypothetical protein